jgi:signal transduction histidine kinase
MSTAHATHTPSLADTNAAEPERSHADLADLLATFNEATSRLEDSHNDLKAQVARLTIDLTQANHQLERARRLAALGEMAAGIAHEIRNPLGPVKLYADMLAQDLRDISPKHAELSARILTASRVMEGIVSDVLTFARELAPRLSPTDAAALCEGALEECCHSGVSLCRSLRITRSFAPDCEIDADPALLRQAIVNIIRNALEAMADHPTTGQPHELTIAVSPAPGRLRIAISDTGPGVSPEVEARMFNPFYTTRNTGTGLGLAIVHRIVDAHKGTVRIRRDHAVRGATFELDLPRRQYTSTHV